jgi:hypothetical protein
MFRFLVATIAAGAMLATASVANATIILYQATLTGPAEAPPNASPGTGIGFVTIDDVANTMHVVAAFGGLISPTIASHIHCCTTAPLTGTANVATAVPTFPGFPLGVTTGAYDMTFDLLSLTTYNPAFVTANGGTAVSARAVLLAGLASQSSYLNIHTIAFPGGEIRGFLTAVPEPATWAMLVLGFGGIGAAMRRRRSSHAKRGRWIAA